MNATHLIAASLFAAIGSTALASETGFSNDSKCNAPTGIGERRACEKAKEGSEALRRSVERTRMIYGLSYWDFYDTVITSQVQAGILDEPTLKVTEIIVDTFKGVVHLSGPVNSRAEADKAVAVALGIGGVNSVKDEMRVKSGMADREPLPSARTWQ